MVNRFYRMPDGSYTKSAEERCDAWKAIAAPIEKMTDSILVAYDPGFSFRRNSNESWWDLPVDIAKMFIASLSTHSQSAPEMIK
jgi:hypothetical protein